MLSTDGGYWLETEALLVIILALVIAFRSGVCAETMHNVPTVGSPSPPPGCLIYGGLIQGGTQQITEIGMCMSVSVLCVCLCVCVGLC